MSLTGNNWKVTWREESAQCSITRRRGMDIRNFFGDKKAAVVKASAQPTVENNVAKSQRRKNVIDDDDNADEELIVAKVAPAEVLPEVASSSSTIITTDTVAQSRKVEELFSIPTIASTKVADSIEIIANDEAAATAAINADVSDIITWKAGESIPYLALVNTFEAISKVSGRLDKESLFCKLFRAIICTTPGELDAIVHLASNSVGPAYEGLELGIGDSLLVKAVCEATGRKKDAVEEDYEKEGDLGTVALLSRNSQKTLSFAMKPKPLLAVHVLEMLRAITRTKGERAQGRKVEIIKGVMVKCQGSEAKYIVRALQGKLRIGTAEQTVLVALAHSFAIMVSRTASMTPSAHLSVAETEIGVLPSEIVDEKDVKEETHGVTQGKRTLLIDDRLFSALLYILKFTHLFM